MKTDLYTKIVLTVIAISLTGILLKDVTFVSKAQAIPLPTDILSTQTEGVMDVNIVQVNGRNISDLPVKVENTMPVEVKNFGTMPTDIKKAATSNNPNLFPIEVRKIDNKALTSESYPYNPIPFSVEVVNTVTVEEK